MKKLLSCIVLLTLLVAGAQAQTIATVNYTDGNSSEFAIGQTGGFYLDSAVVAIRESRIAAETRIPVESIRNITFAPLTDIVEAEDNAMGLFPNPAQDFCRIQLPDDQTHQLEIFGITGMLMMKVSCRNGQQIDISKLPRGLYMARTENQIVKLIKL